MDVTILSLSLFIVLFNGVIVSANYGSGVCNDTFLNGPNKVDDKAITASSVYDLYDKNNNFGPDRARFDSVEHKDAAGVTQIGAWVAEKSNMNQWIQIELDDPTLIRGIISQGRNGCCKQWVTRYRVLYSFDCKTWTTVGGFNVTDAFFKANSDENSAEINIFHCPVIAKCIRVNPLDWNNQIAMRLDLIGCAIGASKQTTSQAATSPTPLVTTTAAPAPSTTRAPVPTTTGAPVQPVTNPVQPVTKAKPSTTRGGGVVMINTGNTGGVTTPKSGVLSGGKKGCIKSCIGMPNGDYQSCKGCDVYVTCSNTIMYGDRPCPKGLKWDNSKKMCDFMSSTCP